MEEYIKSAVTAGLKKITFLEHMEEGIIADKTTWLTEKDFDLYFKEGSRLQTKYQDVIRIGLGVECGYNPFCEDILLKRLESRQWDRVGVSCHFHWLKQERCHLNLFSSRKRNISLVAQHNPRKILEHYFDCLLAAVKFLPATMVCHLDGALRFHPGICLTETHYQQIDGLLGEMNKRGVELELNSSGITIREEQFPNSRIVEMASKHNIQFAFSSDAHKPEDVGKYFNRLTPPAGN